MARVRGRTPRTMTHSRHRYWHFVYTRSSGDASSELDLRASWNNILGRQTTATAAKNLAKNLPAPRAADAAVLDEAKWIRTALQWRRPKRTAADWWCSPFTIQMRIERAQGLWLGNRSPWPVRGWPAF